MKREKSTKKELGKSIKSWAHKKTDGAVEDGDIFENSTAGNSTTTSENSTTTTFTTMNTILNFTKNTAVYMTSWGKLLVVFLLFLFKLYLDHSDGGTIKNYLCGNGTFLNLTTGNSTCENSFDSSEWSVVGNPDLQMAGANVVEFETSLHTNSCICPAVYNPVCGHIYRNRRGVIYHSCKTMSNNCTRNCEEFVFLKNGTCHENCAASPCGSISWNGLGTLTTNCVFDSFCTSTILSPLKARPVFCSLCAKVTTSGCTRFKNAFQFNSPWKPKIQCAIRAQKQNVKGGICDVFGTSKYSCLIPSIQSFCDQAFD